MLAGDFNAHSRWWDPICTEQLEAVFFDRVIVKSGVEIEHKYQATHDRKGEGLEGGSIIDFTLANRLFRQWTAIAQIHNIGSDDQVREWTVDQDKQEEADDEWRVGWTLAAMMQHDDQAAIKL